ncbi:12396_t:CDS:2, partial [Acaulospora colombiana]
FLSEGNVSVTNNKRPSRSGAPIVTDEVGFIDQLQENDEDFEVTMEVAFYDRRVSSNDLGRGLDGGKFSKALALEDDPPGLSSNSL